LIVVAIMMFPETIFSNTMVHAEKTERFWIVLDDDHLNLPNVKYGHGFIALKFSEDLSRLVYNVNVNNIDKIIGVYVYTNSNENQKVSIMLDLLKEVKEQKRGDVNTIKVNRYEVEGTIAVGAITPEDLSGELEGKSLKDLYKLMMNGRLYATVLTEDFPRGELIGTEFVAIDRVFPDIEDFHWN
jgi:CHRD domain